MAGRVSLSVLAKEVGVDLDELLVTVWDCGLIQYDDGSDSAAGSELKQILRALGMPAYGDLRSASYWTKALGLTADELARLLGALGYKWRPGGRPLPVGSPWAIRDANIKSRSVTVTPPCTKTKRPVTSLTWETVGAERQQMRYLTAAEVLGIRAQLARELAQGDDPFLETGVFNESLLESAVGRPLTSLGHSRKYPSVEMAAAALLHSLVLNHPFHDGNKRTALVSMLVFIDENGYLLTCGDDELFRFVLQVAKHSLVRAEGSNRADIECLAAARWLHRNSRQIDHAERPLKWIKLKRILRSYGCSFTTPRVGNRINIYRSVQRKGLLGGVGKKVKLHTQVFWAGDGTEAAQATVATIRRELELDEPHGYDSGIFYGNDDCTIGDFIQLYRMTLRRLSRL